MTRADEPLDRERCGRADRDASRNVDRGVRRGPPGGEVESRSARGRRPRTRARARRTRCLPRRAARGSGGRSGRRPCRDAIPVAPFAW